MVWRYILRQLRLVALNEGHLNIRILAVVYHSTINSLRFSVKENHVVLKRSLGIMEKSSNAGKCRNPLLVEPVIFLDLIGDLPQCTYPSQWPHHQNRKLAPPLALPLAQPWAPLPPSQRPARVCPH